MSDDLEVIRTKCQRMARAYAATACAIALTPIPAIDAAADIGLLSRLLHRINVEFNLTPQQIQSLDPHTQTLVYTAIKQSGHALIGHTLTKTAITTLIKSCSPKITAKYAAKYTPIIGQTLSTTLTYSLFNHISQKHINHCSYIAECTATLVHEQNCQRS